MFQVLLPLGKGAFLNVYILRGKVPLCVHVHNVLNSFAVVIQSFQLYN